MIGTLVGSAAGRAFAARASAALSRRGPSAGTGVGGGPSGPAGTAASAGPCAGVASGGGLRRHRVGRRAVDRLGCVGAVERDRELAVRGLLVAGLDVRLPRVRAFGHRDVVVGQQGPLGLLEGDDRDVVARLELGLLGDRAGVLADGVEVAVDRDPAFLVERPLGLEPLGRGGPEPLGGLELLVVGVDFEEEPGQRVGRLVDDLLEERPLAEQGVLRTGGRWPAGAASRAASGR